MELYYPWSQRLTLVRRTIQFDDGLHQRLPSSASQMHVQARTSTPKHLPIGHSMPLDLEWWRRLEAKHHSEADLVGNSEALERRTKHRKSGAARTPEHVQKWQEEIPRNCESICCQMQSSSQMRKQQGKEQKENIQEQNKIDLCDNSLNAKKMLEKSIF